MSARKLETGIRTISAGIPYTFTHYSCGLRLLGFQLLRFYCNRFLGFGWVLGTHILCWILECWRTRRQIGV